MGACNCYAQEYETMSDLTYTKTELIEKISQGIKEDYYWWSIQNNRWHGEFLYLNGGGLICYRCPYKGTISSWCPNTPCNEKGFIRFPKETVYEEI